jgi:phosphate-selective porin OprO and OprP
VAEGLLRQLSLLNRSTYLVTRDARYQTTALLLANFQEKRYGKFVVVATVLLAMSPLVHAQALASDSDGAFAVVESTPTAPETSSAVSFYQDGVWFSTQDKSTHLQIHGYVQADDRMFSSNLYGEGLDTFLFRRIRPLFEGTLFNAVDFRFMPDFGKNTPQIQEAYLELKSLPFARLRVGKFKEPIGLEILKADRQLIFAERSLASDLLPLRYLGAQVGDSVLSNSITCTVGYFNGSNDGSNGNFQWVQDNEAAARLFFHPFATTGIGAIRNFGIGMAGSSGNQHGTIAGLKTVGQSTFFKYSSTAVANGQHNRIVPQAYYYAGPVGLMSEYVISSQDVLNKKVSGTIQNEAWQVTGTVMLTGEKNSYGMIVPRNTFEPTRGFRHLGAVELAARYSQLRIDHGAFPLFASPRTSAQQAAEYGTGVNWYLNQFVKLTTDYERTNFRMALSTVSPLHSENLVMSRIQLAF